jgi:ABC-type Fe3+/spermidine/putrescine transport system ATPase subunit
VSKSWREFQLKNITLTIEDGEYFILIGPTGAGKTLLLETIMGFHIPSSGKIVLEGKDITTVPPEKRRIGYVSQNSVLFPHMSVRQNVEFGLRMSGINKVARQNRVDAVLASAGLKHLEHRRPSTLSGGERQKVALARVLAVEPDLILLDEPLSALDAEASRELKRELKRIHKNGKTIVHVTHNQVEGFSLGNKMAVMRLGAIVQVGKTREVFAEPQSEFVARFLGYENIFHAQVLERGDKIYTVNVGGIRLKVSEKTDTANIVIAIRPEDVIVHLSPQAEAAALNILEGTIVDCTDQGHTVILTCDAGIQLSAIMTHREFVAANFEENQKVWLSFKSDTIKVIQER